MWETWHPGKRCCTVGDPMNLEKLRSGHDWTDPIHDRGVIDTNLTQGETEGRDAFLETTALGRIGQPEEVASAIIFMLSEKASFMTSSVSQCAAPSPKLLYLTRSSGRQRRWGLFLTGSNIKSPTVRTYQDWGRGD